MEHNASTRYFSGYGMTEFGSVITLNTSFACQSGSVGIPLVFINVKVIGEGGEELPFNQIGELWCSGPNLMSGYFNQEASESIKEGRNGERWFRTGDLAQVNQDGFVFIEGRTKRVYLTRAGDGSIVKLFPQRLEDFISEKLHVKTAAIALQNSDRIHAPFVFIETNMRDVSETHKTTEEIAQLLADGLPDYYQLAGVSFLDEMPMTDSGKIDYRELERRATELAEGRTVL